LAALDFFYKIAKRFLAQHATARRLHFRVDRSAFLQGSLVSSAIANPKPKEDVKFSSGRRRGQERFQSGDSVWFFENLPEVALASGHRSCHANPSERETARRA
jgi:hypothetical protein